MTRKVEVSDYPRIMRRALDGETAQAIANDYGCTREYIRLILRDNYDISTMELRKARCAEAVKRHAEEILYYVENWLSPHWEDYPFNRGQFEQALAESKYPPFLGWEQRWLAAQRYPTSRVGKATPEGRVCATCKVYMPWDDFYRTKGYMNGRSNRCKVCSRKMVDHYQSLRHVPEPTVTEHRCSYCKVVKPASDYWRSTTNNSGLQTYCKDCHRKLQKGERVPKK